MVTMRQRWEVLKEKLERIDYEDFKRVSEFAELLREKLEREFEDKTVLCSNETLTRGELCVACDIGVKFYEISTAATEGLEEVCEEDNLSEKECEELFEDTVKLRLEEINEEFVYYVKGRIETDTVAIEVYPLECERDYCIAGARIYVILKMPIPPSTQDFYATLITNVISAVLKDLP